MFEWFKKVFCTKNDREIKRVRPIVTQINELETGLQKHGEILVEHEAAVRFHVDRIGKHEHALADFEEAGADDELLLRAKKHRVEAEQHLRQRDLHEKTKHAHHALMAEWTRILKQAAI